MAAPPPSQLPFIDQDLDSERDANDEREFVAKQLQAHDRFDKYVEEAGQNDDDSEIYSDPMVLTSGFPTSSPKPTVQQISADDRLARMRTPPSLKPSSVSSSSSATSSSIDAEISKWASYTSGDMVADVLSSITVFSDAPTQNQRWVSNQSRSNCSFNGCAKSMLGMTGYIFYG